MKNTIFSATLVCSLFWIQASCLIIQRLNQTAPVAGSNGMDYQMVEDSDFACPEKPSDSVNAPIKDRAVCPWQTKPNYDKDRLPAVIQEAVCRCKGCMKNGTCEPLYADIPVFRKIANNKFESETLKVAVACQCILKM